MWTALQALPGVGPALARRIVAHREAHGPFRRPADLLRVPGIGAKRLRPPARDGSGRRRGHDAFRSSWTCSRVPWISSCT